VPEFDDSEVAGRAGVWGVGLVVSKMKWSFREQPVPDNGIDCHIGQYRAEAETAQKTRNRLFSSSFLIFGVVGFRVACIRVQNPQTA